jgi:hypothetical protein
MALSRFYFEGDFFSMGLQHGESLSHLIHDLAQERIDIICINHSEISLSLIESIGNEIVQEIKQQAPEVYEEIQGISTGSNIELWKLMVAGGYSDLQHRIFFITNVISPLISECTLLPVRNEKDQILLAGTWDSHATAEAALVMIERHPTIGPSTLALTTAGWPMQQGITSKKLGFAITNLIPSTSQLGISYIGALPHITSQCDIQSAVRSTVSLRLCSGRFYALCDGGGNYVGIETDGINYWTSSILEVHTNHYIYKEAKAVEGRIVYSQISEERRLSAARRLDQIKRVDTKSLFEIISFNDGTSATISQNGINRDDRSCAGFVLDPTNSLITVTKGPPNLSVPEIFTLHAKN